MPAKRPAVLAGASAEGRQFKQTKLNFGSFTPNPSSQPMKPKPEAEKKLQDPDDATKPTTKRLLSPQPDQATEVPPEQQPSSKPSPFPSPPSATLPGNPPSSPPAPPCNQQPLPPEQQQQQQKAKPRRIRLTTRKGDIFSGAPPGALLVHACNGVGSWGGGVAAAFRTRYPRAFAAYRAHCARSTPEALRGTALLVPPPPPPPPPLSPAKQQQQQQQHYIGCLFTSRRFGRARDSPEEILEATGPALRELMRKVWAVEEEEGKGKVSEVRMCRINSGLFGVPWEETRKVIEELELAEGEGPGEGEGGVVEVVVYEI